MNKEVPRIADFALPICRYTNKSYLILGTRNGIHLFSLNYVVDVVSFEKNSIYTECVFLDIECVPCVHSNYNN